MLRFVEFLWNDNECASPVSRLCLRGWGLWAGGEGGGLRFGPPRMRVAARGLPLGLWIRGLCAGQSHLVHQ